jgi:hypothetical protein
MLYNYKNGNAMVSIAHDGSRVVEYEDTLQLDYPLNIDIRVSTKCSFGAKADGTPGFCSFCHESTKQNGSECDYLTLRDKLYDLPKGIELAIGANTLTDNLFEFLWWAKCEGYICNLTINQGHLKRDLQLLNKAIEFDMIKGLGISYRGGLKWDVPQELLDYDNTVFHVIAGIDTYAEVEALADKGVKKILVLGEKDFGFNKGNVNLDSRNHKEWFWWVHKLFSRFKAVSFDNLALTQLRIQRFFTGENWAVFNQGEHSFYLNAVEGYYAPSSRSNEKTDWNKKNIFEYFKNLEKDGSKRN